MAQTNLGKWRWVIWGIMGIFALVAALIIIGGMVIAIQGGGLRIAEQKSHNKASKAYVDPGFF